MRGADVVEWGPLRFERHFGSGYPHMVRLTLLVDDERVQSTYVHLGNADYFRGLHASIEAMFPEFRETKDCL